MANSTNLPDTWGEWIFVTIESSGASSTGSKVELSTLIQKSSVTVKIGDKSFDIEELANGGNIEKSTPQEPYEVSFDVFLRGGIDVEDGDDSGFGMGLTQFFPYF